MIRSYAVAQESSNRPMSCLIIDLRCLQDTDYTARGIGLHVSTFLNNRMAGLASHVVGIIDPDLPELAAAVVACTDEIRPNGYFPTNPPGTVFLNPSPLTHDPLFVARLLLNSKIKKVAFVYDFIPFENQPAYLSAPSDRLNYIARIAWLKRYDLFLPISEHTQNQLRQFVAGAACIVTGVALPPWIRAGASPGRRHILAVSGGDPRKNPETIIRAHAASTVLQSRGVPLVIAGQYRAETEARFRALAQQSGGNPSLLKAPGHVSQETLLSQYQDALCVVTASRAEGFSLPVVEAMAAGVPSVVSDIPVHAALVRNAALRFDPDDASALGQILDRIASEPAYRDTIIAEQAAIWPAFEASIVTGKINAAIADVSGVMPSTIHIGGRRPCVAFLSILPPTQSGVADYSAACAAALSDLVNLSVFCPAENALPIDDIPLHPLSALPHVMHRFDCVISVLGNSHYHDSTFDLMKRYGGAAICHDARLLHFYANKFGLSHTARLATKELQRLVSDAELEAWLHDETKRRASLLQEAASHAWPLIFHAQASVDHVLQRFQTTARYIPFAVYHPWQANALTSEHKQAAKSRLNFARGETHIVSFGFLASTKGVDVALQALQQLVRAGTPCHLHWVGKPGTMATPTLNLAAELGVAAHMSLTPDFLSEANYRDYLLAGDIAVQLRTTGQGNISGALQDCIAAGLPTIANHSLAEVLNAPDYVTRIPDALDPNDLARALAKLINTMRRSTEPERADYCDRYSMANYALNLCNVLGLAV